MSPEIEELIKVNARLRGQIAALTHVVNWLLDEEAKRKHDPDAFINGVLDMIQAIYSGVDVTDEIRKEGAEGIRDIAEKLEHLASWKPPT